MATPNVSNILVGAPDQTSTGAIFTAAIGSTLPTDANTALTTPWASAGYVTEDGVTLSNEFDTVDIKDWSGKVCRVLSTSASATVSFAALEFSKESLEQAFGASNVVVSGGVTAITNPGVLPTAMSWVFNIKDGSKYVRLVIPNGQVTNFPDITFRSDEAITLPIELRCLPDGSGNVWYMYQE